MMKKFTNKLLKSLPYIAIAILISVTVTYAAPGSKLTPPASITNTMYSLTDIFNLSTGTLADEGTGTIETTPALAETGKTLTQVYTAISDEIVKLTPEVLLSGNTIFGVEGTATSGLATLTWQTNPNINLCWSNGIYENENGCTVGSGFTTTPNEETILGAVEYCQYLNADGETLANTAQNIWHLPTIQEYQSITDYTLYNSATEVPGFADVPHYWSSTESAGYPGVGAWNWNSRDGGTSDDDRYFQHIAVRCARLASPVL